MNKIKTTISKNRIDTLFLLSPQDIVSETSLALVNQNQNYCVPLVLNRTKGIVLTGSVEGMIPLEFYCRQIQQAVDFSAMLLDVNQALLSLEKRQVILSNIDYAPQRVFVNPKSRQVRFLCWPLVNYDPDYRMEDFYKEIVKLCSFEDVEQERLLSEIRSFLKEKKLFRLQGIADELPRITSGITEEPKVWGVRDLQEAWAMMNDTPSHSGFFEKLFRKNALTVAYSSFTNQGDRKVNEDSIRVQERNEAYCFSLADGLGGHGMGDIASSYAVNTTAAIFNQSNSLSLDTVATAFQAAQDIVVTEQLTRHATSKMKTTMVNLIIEKNNAYVGFIGDSRLYHFRNHGLKSRTIDHSVPQTLALAGDIKESEIRYHKERSCLLKVIGVEWEEPEYELWKPIKIKPGDAFLLCSDGFWELIVEEKMCGLLSSCGSVSEWLHEMLCEVRKNGKDVNMDNYSAIAVWIN